MDSPPSYRKPCSESTRPSTAKVLSIIGAGHRLGLHKDTEMMRATFRERLTCVGASSDATPALISEAAHRVIPDIIVYSGHATVEGLLLSNGVFLDHEDFVDILRSCYRNSALDWVKQLLGMDLPKTLCCVFLSCCNSKLYAMNISCAFPQTPVIYWDSIVEDSAAAGFARTFCQHIAHCSKYELGDSEVIQGAYRAARRQFEQVFSLGDPTQSLNIESEAHRQHHINYGLPLTHRSKQCRFCFPREHGICGLLQNGEALLEDRLHPSPPHKAESSASASPNGNLRPRRLFASTGVAHGLFNTDSLQRHKKS